MASRCFGVMPPKAMFGRSWLYIYIQWVAYSLYLFQVAPMILGQPFVTHRAVEPLHVSVLLWLAWLDVFEPDTPQSSTQRRIVSLMFSGP
jgi:hypothetical protein